MLPLHSTLKADLPPLHSLELQFTFSPPHAAGETGVLKWLPNLHRGT